MSVFASLGILFSSMLIVASLQLVPGIFALFSHYALGKNSRRKASDLSLAFIFGSEAGYVLFFLITYFVLSAFSFLPINFHSGVFTWAITGIILAIGFFFPLFYYRHSRGTKLFISRKLAKNINEKARSAKTRSDAFTLGFISILPELIFTIPLFIISSLEIMQIGLNPFFRSGIIILFVFFAIIPLLVLHSLFYSGSNLAEIARNRNKNKSFNRLFITILYFVIAVLIITFRITS